MLSEKLMLIFQPKKIEIKLTFWIQTSEKYDHNTGSWFGEANLAWITWSKIVQYHHFKISENKMPRDIFTAEFCPFRSLYPWEKKQTNPQTTTPRPQTANFCQ